MKVKDVGDAALIGWREKVAAPVARRAPVRDEYVRAALGLLFLSLSIRHLAETARRIAAKRSS
jgi:hypothetical protein